LCFEHAGQLLPLACFVATPEFRVIRLHTRYRRDLTAERTREKQRAEKLLESAAIKISSVITDLHGVTGRDIMDHLIAGERNPQVLAQLARRSARRKISQLEEALDGAPPGSRWPGWRSRSCRPNRPGAAWKTCLPACKMPAASRCASLISYLPPDDPDAARSGSQRHGTLHLTAAPGCVFGDRAGADACACLLSPQPASTGNHRMGPMADTRACEQCGIVFTPGREHARFCSATCRIAWNQEHTGDSRAEASALDWSVTAMREAVERLAREQASDQAHGLELISDAVWRVTLVDATLVRYHPQAYETVMKAQDPAARRTVEATLAGLRFVRNRMGISRRSSRVHPATTKPPRSG
jgi:hypothetical protein